MNPEVFNPHIWHDRTIGYRRIGHIRVSTCKLTIPETHCGGIWPYETMVFDHSSGNSVEVGALHYKTRDEARIGHDGCCEHWTRKVAQQ